LEKTAIDMLRERVDNRIFERSHGPYRSPWFLVKKSSGRYRIVNAALQLNAVTIKDANMPPSTDELSEEFSGMVITSLIDLFSGYDQLPLEKSSRDLTAFHTPIGLLRQTRLPQGWTNAVQNLCEL